MEGEEGEMEGEGGSDQHEDDVMVKLLAVQPILSRSWGPIADHDRKSIAAPDRIHF